MIPTLGSQFSPESKTEIRSWYEHCMLDIIMTWLGCCNHEIPSGTTVPKGGIVRGLKYSTIPSKMSLPCRNE